VSTEYYNGKPIFLVSPPGSLEAAEIGYINIPKIVDEPPEEIKKIHNFELAKDATERDITKNLIEEDVIEISGLEFSTKKSNFWIYRPFVESKKAFHDLIVPLIPNYIKYAVPWIVCEYALHCVVTNDILGFKNFVYNTIEYRLPNYMILGDIVLRKNWRIPKKKWATPIHYLKGSLKRIKEREKEEIDKENQLAREWKDKKGLYHLPNRLSLDGPIISSDPIAILGGDEEALSRLESGFSDISPEAESFFQVFDIERSNARNLLICRENTPSEILTDICNNVGLPNNATQLLKSQIEGGISRRAAANKLGLSNQEYESARKSIYRKRDSFYNELVKKFPDLPKPSVKK
jgi:hypothetical protein